MHEELNVPELWLGFRRLKSAGLRVGPGVDGQTEHKVPYSPIHSNNCVIDDYIVLEGSFNGYNTSVFSHDLLLVAANHDVARPRTCTSSTRS